MSWDRIRGHDDIRRQFQTAASQGRLGHAYLFVGPAGIGKRLFADELAATLLCESPSTSLSACGRCTGCKLVAAGTHPDFFSARKPDDKHELPIDVIREFVNSLGLTPARGRRKIGILEDADDFNDESANCFLKTLEEPPPGSVLILLATSEDIQLPTIRSRCQVVHFHPLSATVLRELLAAQGVADPARADQLARLAQGSIGRALALNDVDLWAFRTQLVAAISATRPDPVALAGAWTEFIEEAGKETAAQRERASLVIQLLLAVLRTALRTSLGADAENDSAESQALAERFGSDGLTDLMESCVEADYRIDRRVQIVLITEWLVDRLTRPTSRSGRLTLHETGAPL